MAPEEDPLNPLAKHQSQEDRNKDPLNPLAEHQNPRPESLSEKIEISTEEQLEAHKIDVESQTQKLVEEKKSLEKIEQNRRKQEYETELEQELEM